MFERVRYRYVGVVASTQDVALEAVRAGALETPVVFWTDRQTAGRGRHGNRWWMPEAGAVAFSMVVEPYYLMAAEVFWLQYAVVLAVANALRRVGGVPARIKLPNDIVVRGRKIGGVLIDTAVGGGYLRWAVIGVGLNVNVVEFPPSLHFATSILKERGEPVLEEKALEAVAENVALYCARLRARPWSWLRIACYNRFDRAPLLVAGEGISVQAMGIDEGGWVVVKDRYGHQRRVRPDELTGRYNSV